MHRFIRIFKMPSRVERHLHYLMYLAVALLLAEAVGSGAVQPAGIAKFNLTPGPLQLDGMASPWRFVNAVGEESGLWGFENGQLEGWVYPLKIFHDFHLAFQLEGLPESIRVGISSPA